MAVADARRASRGARLRDRRTHHHATYPDDLPLPLQGLHDPGAVRRRRREAGWERIRLARLRDVEWAIERRQPWPLGTLTRRARYAIIADAPR